MNWSWKLNQINRGRLLQRHISSIFLQTNSYYFILRARPSLCVSGIRSHPKFLNAGLSLQRDLLWRTQMLHHPAGWLCSVLSYERDRPASFLIYKNDTFFHHWRREIFSKRDLWKAAHESWPLSDLCSVNLDLELLYASLKWKTPRCGISQSLSQSSMLLEANTQTLVHHRKWDSWRKPCLSFAWSDRL